LLTIGEIDDDAGRRGFVEITGLLPPDIFDSVASALITGGRDLLARSRLHIGFKDERDKIDFDRRDGSLADR
jgi:hypothetical protein